MTLIQLHEAITILQNLIKENGLHIIITDDSIRFIKPDLIADSGGELSIKTADLIAEIGSKKYVDTQVGS